MKTEYTTLHIDREYELRDLAEAWDHEQVCKKLPAHIDRFRDDPEKLTDALNDYLFDNEHMARLAKALISPNLESILFMANLREMVQDELMTKARTAAEAEVDRMYEK